MERLGIIMERLGIVHRATRGKFLALYYNNNTNVLIIYTAQRAENFWPFVIIIIIIY